MAFTFCGWLHDSNWAALPKSSAPFQSFRRKIEGQWLLSVHPAFFLDTHLFSSAYWHIIIGLGDQEGFTKIFANPIVASFLFFVSVLFRVFTFVSAVCLLTIVVFSLTSSTDFCWPQFLKPFAQATFSFSDLTRSSSDPVILFGFLFFMLGFALTFTYEFLLFV